VIESFEIYSRWDVKEEKIEWVENPENKKIFRIVPGIIGVGYAIIFALSFFFSGFGWGFLFGFISISVSWIILAIRYLSPPPEHVGFTKEGIYFKYKREKVEFLPWHEISGVNIDETRLFSPEEWGGGYILLKSGKIMKVALRYNVAKVVRRRHEEYKEGKGLL
jgi:hypothetical protein